MINLKRGTEFAYGDSIYKVCDNSEGVDGFMAIWIGYADQKKRYLTTYNGYIKHGDFKLDRALFRMTLTKLGGETGVIGQLVH